MALAATTSALDHLPEMSYETLRSLWASAPVIALGGASAAIALALVLGSGMWRLTVRRFGG